VFRIIISKQELIYRTLIHNRMLMSHREPTNDLSLQLKLCRYNQLFLYIS